MSRKHLPALLIAVVVVIGAILLLLPGETGRDDSPGAMAALLPGLQDRVNDVDRIDVVTAGDTLAVQLRRGDAGWAVEELGGYPADLETVRTVLAGLAQSEVLEPKTANPELHARLGVEDVAQADATGLRLDIAAGDGVNWSLVVGNDAPNRGGHYLRREGEAQSLLADFEARVPAEPSGWVNPRVVDLASPEVAEVRITHADGETLTVSKLSADETDFSLAELPAGREPISTWSVNSLGSVLSVLDFDDVQAVANVDWTDAIHVHAVRFDGLAVDARLVRVGDEAWLRLEAATPSGEDARRRGCPASSSWSSAISRPRRRCAAP